MPAFAASCPKGTIVAPWGYKISDDGYLCRGHKAKGHEYQEKNIGNTDTFYTKFTIKPKTGQTIPAGSRFLFTISFSKDAYTGDKTNNKGIYIASSPQFSVVGDNGFKDMATTIAIDLAQNIPSGKSVTVWIRVVSENMINEGKEDVIVSGQLEEPGSLFDSRQDPNSGCREAISRVFDGDYDKNTRTYTNLKDGSSESDKACKGYDNETWLPTATVVVRS